MADSPSILYVETYVSPWRKAVAWLWGAAGILVVLFLVGLAARWPYLLQEGVLAKGHFFLAFAFGASAIYVRTTLPNGAITVTKEGIRILQESHVAFLPKSELVSWNLKAVYLRKGGAYVLRDEGNPSAGLRPCTVRPYHLPLVGMSSKGVLVETVRSVSSPQPLFRWNNEGLPVYIPTKNPSALMDALDEMRR